MCQSAKKIETKNQSHVHYKFKNFILKHDLFHDKISILAAISGGQDSICLLKLLKDYHKDKRLEIHIVYFDHGWRKDSSNNSYFLRNIADRWSILFHYEKSDTILSEEQARVWRYSTMQAICKSLKISYIITGHTYSDRLETIFFNIMQGTGFEGILSLQPYTSVSSKISIIHPLIEIKREETLWFCRNFSLPVWSDITNYKKRIKRNRIREELIPYCKQYLNVNLDNTFKSFLENVSYDLDYLQEKTYYLYYKYKHPRYVGINKRALLFFPLSIKKRVIRSFIYQNTNIKLNFSDTRKYLLLVNSKKIEIKQLSPLWFLCISHNWIYLLSKKSGHKVVKKNNNMFV
nr:Ycf62 [Porphyrostromium boryanum]